VRGFTLLEVMISLVVLAIGVMGVIGLQTATYQQLQTSQNFSKAAMLASDMADRMLANQENVLATAYVHNAPPAEPPDTDCTTAACTTPAQLAAYDVWRWQTELLGRDWKMI
jgi:type IV pilus assembly protein PilV